MTPQETAWYAVCPAKSLPMGAMTGIEIRGNPVALYHLETGYFATERNCTHEAADLTEGKVMGEAVICPRHRARFQIQSGRILRQPAWRSLKTYPVKVEAGQVFVGLPHET